MQEMSRLVAANSTDLREATAAGVLALTSAEHRLGALRTAMMSIERWAAPLQAASDGRCRIAQLWLGAQASAPGAWLVILMTVVVLGQSLTAVTTALQGGNTLPVSAEAGPTVPREACDGLQHSCTTS